MNKSLITNLIIFAVLFVSVWFLLWPMLSGVSEIRNEITTKQGTVDLERQVVEKLNSINQVLDTQKTNVERLEQAIPNAELRPELLSIMENLANQNGLGMAGINIDAPPEEGAAARRSATPAPASLKKVKVDVKVSGTYGSFKNWLNAIERNLRITDITKISFSISEKKNDEGGLMPVIDPSIDYSVSMIAYLLKK